MRLSFIALSEFFVPRQDCWFGDVCIVLIGELVEGGGAIFTSIWDLRDCWEFSEIRLLLFSYVIFSELIER